MKFNTVSGKLDVSSTHVPGRGSGTFDLSTGNQAELEVACSLNFPIYEDDAKNDLVFFPNPILINKLM